jgi:transcriptional regulator with XRE-family HTH domain
MARKPRPKSIRLPEKLVQIRLALNLSQNEMLSRLGLDRLNRTTVSAYELGTGEPPLPILLKYARLAGVCMERLVDDDLDLPKLPAKGHKP